MSWLGKDIKAEARKNLKPDFWHVWFASSLVAVLSYFTVITFTLNSIEEIPGIIKNLGKNIEHNDRKQILAVVLVLVMGVFLLNALIQFLISVFVKNPVSVGASRLYLGVHGNEEHRGRAADLMYPFDNSYRNVVWIMLVKVIRQMVFYILLIIPGIWRTYTYRMVPYLLAEKPEMSVEEAFATSINMVNGHKWRIFIYDLSFIPWYILSLISFGIVHIFWTRPYKNMADAKLYLKLKEIYNNETVEVK